MRNGIAGICLLVLALGAVAAGAQPSIDPAGHWEGRIEVPGTPLGVLIDLENGPEGWTGTIDIPLQGAEGLALTAIAVRDDSVTFAIANIPGDPTFHGVLADSAGAALLHGDFTQGGQRFPFRLGREAVVGDMRPQEPKPPFPYTEEEVGYENGDVHLAATLTIPAGDGPFPAAVLITGSGAQDRNEELMGHKPFLVLADHLTRAGIAVLRADDRGIGGSTGNTMQSTTADFADDALAGLRFLASRPEIDPQRIGLVGHSEGGIVGPLAASGASDEVAYIVMLAGTGVPLDEVVVLQSGLLSRARGRGEEQVQKEMKLLARVFDLVKADADSAAVYEAVRDLAIVQMTAAVANGAQVDEAELEKVTRGSAWRMMTPWFRFATAHDPRPVLREVRCPVLALNGTKDLQVDPDQNVPEIEQALAASGNPDTTVRRLDGLNHLFQKCEIGSIAEYATIEETMDPEVLELVAGWINERFGGED